MLKLKSSGRLTRKVILKLHSSILIPRIIFSEGLWRVCHNSMYPNSKLNFCEIIWFHVAIFLVFLSVKVDVNNLFGDVAKLCNHLFILKTYTFGYIVLSTCFTVSFFDFGKSETLTTRSNSFYTGNVVSL